MELIAYALVLLIDLAFLLVVIRLICLKRSVPLLSEFDSAGGPLVDRLMRTTSAALLRIRRIGRVTDSQALGAALIGLLLVRMLMRGLMGAAG